MFYEALKRRRSIRRFADKRIEEDKVERLLRAALLSPSSRGIRPWEFVLVDDRDLLSKLAGCKPHGAGFLGQAAIAIVVLAETSKSDVWVEDTSIASAIILLMAQDMGLGACWCQIRRRFREENATADQYVRQLLGVPDNYEVASIIGVGYPAEHKPPYDEKDLALDKIHRNAF